MKPLRMMLALLVGLCALLAPPAIARGPSPSPAPAAQTAKAPSPVDARPALWKLSDRDTTIYLFGTIHALPDGVDWYKGPLRQAFERSDSLITELPEVPQGEVIAAVLKLGTLPGGETLHGMMSPEQFGKYEAAMTELGLPAAAFDQRKPWSVAMLLPVVKAQKLGFNPQQGVEAQLSEHGRDLKIPRAGLETLQDQLGIFDSFTLGKQLEYLLAVVDSLPQVDAQINAMVGHWARGDPAALAGLLNADEGDREFAEALIYKRNRNWAKWIAQRMKQPGTVFIAVGAGHLGGRQSVQKLLARRGFRITRVQ